MVNRTDALKAAEDAVARMTTAPTNARGYTVDGYKAPTLAERVKAILDLAEFLTTQEPEPEPDVEKADAAPEPHSRACPSFGHEHGYDCAVSCPTCGGTP